MRIYLSVMASPPKDRFQQAAMTDSQTHFPDRQHSAGFRPMSSAGLLAAWLVMAGPALAQQVTSGSTEQSAGLATLRGSTASSDDAATTKDTTAAGTATPSTTAKTRADDREDTLDTDSFRRITNDALDANRINLRESPVDERRQLRKTEDDGTGIHVGTMILRPELSQGISTERKSTGSDKQNTTYWDNGLKGTLTSDWSRHQLVITGDGQWRQRIAGDRDSDPSGRVDAALRLDFADDIAARLTAGYGFSRESTTDPNAVRNASVQSGVNQFSAGAVLERQLGPLKGSVGLDFERWVYTDAKLANGSMLSNSDRNRNAVTLSSRLGYEISPALTPFVEVSAGKTRYDQTEDSAGYRRSGNIYGAKAGISSDMGEKLRGEIALGYKLASFDDTRLEDLGAMTVDGNVAWSPLRGTNVDLGLATSIEPSTTAGVSGDVAYALTAVVTHELRDNLIAKLSGGTTWRNYRGGSQSTGMYYTAGGGLVYKVNRWLDLTADLTWEKSTSDSSSDDKTLTAGVGLKLRR
ncbi:outer membrane beta-barrel protein [Agrobacterium vitis]|nr:outer membrane beta-barrel protein [Agrobacterium vitis]